MVLSDFVVLSPYPTEIGQWLVTFWLSQFWDVTGNFRVEAREAAKHPVSLIKKLIWFKMAVKPCLRLVQRVLQLPQLVF